MKPSDYAVMDAFLMCVLDCLSRGDRQRIQELGLDYREAEELASFTLEERHSLHDYAAHRPGIEIKAKQPVIRQWIASVKRSRATEKKICALLLGGASRDMMEHFCGMSHDEYGRYKRRLGLGPNPSGRIRLPDKSITKIIADAWHERLGESADLSRATAEDFLAVHQATGVSLRQLWSWVQYKQRATTHTCVKKAAGAPCKQISG